MLSKLDHANSDKMVRIASTTEKIMKLDALKNYHEIVSNQVPLINSIDDFLTTQLGCLDDDVLLIKNKHERRIQMKLSSKVYSSDTNFFDDKSIRINDKFSKSERIAYYEMLVRERASTKTRKAIKKAARKLALLTTRKTEADYEEFADGGPIPPTIADAFDNFKDIIREFVESDLKQYFMSDKDFTSDDYASIADIVGNDYLPVFVQMNSLRKSGIDFKWIMHLLITFFQLMESKSRYMDMLILAEYCLVCSMQEKSVLISAVLFPLMASIRSMTAMLRSDKINRKVEALDTSSSYGISEFLFAGRATTASFISSHLMMSIREIVLILSSYHLFSPKIARQLQLWLGKVDKPKSLPEATSKIVTDIGNVIRMGEALRDGVPLHEIFLTPDPTESAKKTMGTLLYEYNYIYYGLPTEGGIEAKTWVAQARSVIESVRNIQKRTNSYDVRTCVLEKEMRNLTEKLIEVTSRSFRSKRVPPYLVVLGSPPGTGKSSLITFVCQLWSAIKNRDFDQTHVYERTVSSQYWDGYDPWSNPVVHYSEIGALKAKLAEAGQDKAILELISVCDSLPYSLDMSSVNDKGRFFCMPELVVIDTNNLKMNLDCVVRNISAFMRRGIFIIPTVKEAFRLPNSTMLDGSIHSDDMMDKWHFEVYRTTPIDNDKYNTNHLMRSTEDDDIHKLVQVLSLDMKTHLERETNVLVSLSDNWVKKHYPNGFFRTVVESSGVEVEVPIDHRLDSEVKTFFDDEKFWVETDDKDFMPHIDFYGNNMAEEKDMIERGVEAGFECYTLSARKLLNNALGAVFPGNTNFDPDIVVKDLCDCCEFGYHQETFSSRAKTFSIQSKRHISMFIKTGMHLYLSFAFAMANFSDEFSLILCLAIFFGLLMTYYVPYFCYFTYVTIFLSIVKYITNSLESVLGNVVKRQVIAPFYQKWDDTFRDCKNFFRRNQSLMIKTSLIVTGVLCAAKVYQLFSEKKRKRNVESDFVTPGAVYVSAREKEVRYDMSAPETRIRKKLPQKVYDNVLVRDPPVYTGTDLSQFQSCIVRNMRPVNCISTYSDRTFERKAYLFGVSGSYAIIMGHFFDFVKSPICKMFVAPNCVRNEDGKYNYCIENTITKDDLREIATDLFMVKVNGVQFRDILKFIPANIQVCRSSAVMVDSHSTRASDDIDSESMDAAFDRTILHKNTISYDWPEHANGKCGWPVSMQVNGGCFVIALHVAGDMNGGAKGFSVKIDRNSIENAISSLSDGFRVYSKVEADIIFGVEPDARSFLRFIDQGPVEAYGKVHAFNGNQSTNIIPSFFQEDDQLVDVFLEILPPHQIQLFAPAILAPTKGGNLSKGGSPLTRSAQKLCTVKKSMDKKVLRKCADLLVDRITGNLAEAGVVRNKKPFDFQSAINGSPDDWLARKVDLAKSGGYRYPGAKKRYMIESLIDNNPIYEPTPCLMEDVNTIMESYENAQSINPVFKVFMKDEVRPIEKVRAYNTRTVYGTPLPYLIVQKAFLGPLYSLMIEHSDAFYCALGTDMHRHGHLIKNQIVKFFDINNSSHNWGEGDYGGFDTSMPYEIGEYSCYVETKILRWLGYTDNHMTIVNGLMSDTMFPRVDFFGDMLSVPGLQTSGRYGTAENNCFRNVLILMYAWYINPDLSEKDFFEFVLPVVYGDDVLMGVLDPVKHIYNNNAIALSCASFGIDYTSSSKSSVFEDFVQEEDISFLKRTFRYHPVLGREVSTLSLQSIEKMLDWIEVTRSGELHVQYDGLIRSALYELFFWLDEKSYDKIRSFFITKYIGHYAGVQYNFPTYSSLVEHFSLSDEEIRLLA